MAQAEDYTLPTCKYEYLDHTADVQLHSWGETLREAFEQCGLAMFGYMSDLETVHIRQMEIIEVAGSDLENLLFHFLNELLFLFSCEPFLICSKLVITDFRANNRWSPHSGGGAGDGVTNETDDDEQMEFAIKCKCYGEPFQLGVHPQGTEVKAITYSAMQIVQKPDEKRFDCYVIIDI